MCTVARNIIDMWPHTYIFEFSFIVLRVTGVPGTCVYKNLICAV